MEAYEQIDPRCPIANAFAERIQQEVASEELTGEAAFVYSLKRVNADAMEHKRTCYRCRSYTTAEQDQRTPTWGGATLGFLVGVIVAFFRTEPYWLTVAVATSLGAILGLLTTVPSRFNRNGTSGEAF